MTSLAGVFLSVPGAALAQQGAGPTLLDEIVVTAQKREQSLQTVGIAITAFSGDQMKSLGIEQSVDIAQFTPGVSLSGSFAGQMQQFSIRGVTQNDFNDHVEAPIAVYIDEGYVAMQQGQAFSMFDVDRVELLKGPQGTLFGRNATGGLVHYLTNRPTEEFEGYADATYGSYDQVRLEAAVSGPLGDNILGRLSAMYNRHDGYLKNEYPEQTHVPAALRGGLDNGLPQPAGAGADLGNDDTWAARAQLLFKLSDSTDLLVTAFGSESTLSVGAYQSAATVAVFDAGGGHVNTIYASPTETREAIGPNGTGLNGTFDPDPDTIRPVPGGDFFGYIDPDGNDFRTSSNFAFDDLNMLQTYGGNVKLSMDLDQMTVTAITDYKNYKKFFSLDLEAAPVDQFAWLSESEEDTFTQEIRLNGEMEEARWVAGFYYLNISNSSANGLSALDSSMTGFPFDQPRAVALDTVSYSLFGQMEYDLSDSLTLIAGLRGTIEQKDFDYEVTITPQVDPKAWDFANPLGLSGFTRAPFRDSTEETLWTGKVQLDWKPNDDWLVYAGINRGVKAGSFNSGDATLADEDIRYDKEVLLAYEIGFKSTLFDGRARLNGAVYYYDYNDYQASRWLGFANLITNNDATVKGLELDLLTSPIDNLDVMLSLGLIDAEVEDVDVGGSLRDVRPTFSPETTASGLVRYTIPADIFGGELALQGDISYQSGIYHNLANFDASRFDGYTLVNLRMSWLSGDGSWQTDLFVKNVTDERYNTIGFDLAQVCGCNEEAQGKPRWWGISVRHDF